MIDDESSDLEVMQKSFPLSSLCFVYSGFLDYKSLRIGLRVIFYICFATFCSSFCDVLWCFFVWGVIANTLGFQPLPAGAYVNYDNRFCCVKIIFAFSRKYFNCILLCLHIMLLLLLITGWYRCISWMQLWCSAISFSFVAFIVSLFFPWCTALYKLSTSLHWWVCWWVSVSTVVDRDSLQSKFPFPYSILTVCLNVRVTQFVIFLT